MVYALYVINPLFLLLSNCHISPTYNKWTSSILQKIWFKIHFTISYKEWRRGKKGVIVGPAEAPSGPVAVSLFYWIFCCLYKGRLRRDQQVLVSSGTSIRMFPLTPEGDWTAAVSGLGYWWAVNEWVDWQSSRVSRYCFQVEAKEKLNIA